MQAMTTYDYIACFFCFITVALVMIGEVKDIKLCKFLVDEDEGRLSSRSLFLLRGLAWIRYWVFLPSLMVTVLTLVVFRGGDALTVCFNTIA